MSEKEVERWSKHAAVYVRMSTEHQQYSTSNQMDVIREYAKRRGWEIGKEYSDEGKSGLNIRGRDALAQMIQDVQNGVAEFALAGGFPKIVGGSVTVGSGLMQGALFFAKPGVDGDNRIPWPILQPPLFHFVLAEDLRRRLALIFCRVETPSLLR